MGKAAAAKYFIEILGKFFKTGSKEVADQIKKNNPRARVTTTAPKGVRVDNLKPPPKSLSQPQNPKTGKFQKPSPVPAKPKAPGKPPAKPSAPKSTSPAKPSTQTTSVARPKPSTKAPAKPTGGTGGSRYTGGRGRKKPPLMDKKLVRERPNMPPKPQTSRPAILRDSVRPAAPDITKDDLKPVEKKKEGTPSKRLDTKPKTPKKKMSPGSSPRPKLRPATGPVTNESFKDAFRRNRKNKNATFTWKGKKYSTRYKEETVAEHKKKFGDY